MSNRTVSSFTSQVVEVSTNVPFDTVISRLDAAIAKDAYNYNDYARQIVNIHDKQSFMCLMDCNVKNDFMYFNSYEYGHDLSVVAGCQIPRRAVYAIGNPKIGTKIMILNPPAAYSIPPHLAVLEKEGGNGTTILYHVLSSILKKTTPGESEELNEILVDLDAKFEKLVTFISSPDSEDCT